MFSMHIYVEFVIDATAQKKNSKYGIKMPLNILFCMNKVVNPTSNQIERYDTLNKILSEC